MEARCPELTSIEAHRTLDRFRVVDVRDEHEFDGPLGHVAGAELVPLPRLGEQLPDLARSGPLLLVCRSGRRSAEACARLLEGGAREAINLAGGMIAWNRSGLPVERRRPVDLPALLEQIVRWLGQVGPDPESAVRDRAREQLARHGATPEAPSHEAIAALVEGSALSLAERPPADLDLSLAAFRRSLSEL